MAGDTETADLAALFSRDGVVCVRAALDPVEVTAAASAIEKVLANPGPLAQIASGNVDPGLFTEAIRGARQGIARGCRAGPSAVPGRMAA